MFGTPEVRAETPVLPGWVLQKGGWGGVLGLAGGVVSGRDAAHAPSAATFPVHFSWWEGRAEQAHV